MVLLSHYLVKNYASLFTQPELFFDSVFRSRKLHLLALLGLFQTEMTDSPTFFMLQLS